MIAAVARAAVQCFVYKFVHTVILSLLHDWLRTVVFQLNLEYLHVKITNPVFASSSINK